MNLDDCNAIVNPSKYIGFIDRSFISYPFNLKDMLKSYGKTVYVVAMEECAELQTALLTNTSFEDFKNIVEECVDILIVLDWLRELVSEDTITVASMGYRVSSISTTTACTILANSIKTFSKTYRGMTDLDSKVMNDTMHMLARLIVRIFVENRVSKATITAILDKKISKIEENYRANKQH